QQVEYEELARLLEELGVRRGSDARTQTNRHDDRGDVFHDDYPASAARSRKFESDTILKSSRWRRGSSWISMRIRYCFSSESSMAPRCSSRNTANEVLARIWILRSLVLWPILWICRSILFASVSNESTLPVPLQYGHSSEKKCRRLGRTRLRLTSTRPRSLTANALERERSLRR